MLNAKKIGSFIAECRKASGLTQQQLADRLKISFQAVSKWETGTSFPNTELLYDLSSILSVSVDELLAGTKKPAEGLSYSQAGIDIAYTDTIKKDMSEHMRTSDQRVLNGLGPFASLYDINFPQFKNPVLVLKSEEPGSKQKLAMEYGFTESICHDMINHLVNDIIVMGAKPLAVLDTIICGNAEKDTISTLIKGMADACRNNECSLIGGETSIQPQVIKNGVYVLTSSIAGIADRSKIIDGSQIEEGDVVLSVASNGLHTNGYSLVRLLMEKSPHIKLEKFNGLTFIEQIMKPHTPYYKTIKDLLKKDLIHGMAHITGGGIKGNLCRIIPDGLCAEINLACLNILPVFKFIKSAGNISDTEMLSTFNCGTGLVIVASPNSADTIIQHISRHYECRQIGNIKKGINKINFTNSVNWI